MIALLIIYAVIAVGLLLLFAIFGDRHNHGRLMYAAATIFCAVLWPIVLPLYLYCTRKQPYTAAGVVQAYKQALPKE